MDLWGNTPVGILILDAILLVVSVILIPLLYAIFRYLRTITDSATVTQTAIVEVCNMAKETLHELTEARLRDERARSEYEQIKRQLERLEDQIRG